MTTTVQTRCPAWCCGRQSHEYDTDGTFLAHVRRVETSVSEAAVMVIKDYTSDPAVIDVEVSGGDGWTTGETLAFIGSLVQAIWIADPDFENPADHDKTGLWLATGKAIRKRMAEAGLSQTEMGPMIGISQPEFSIISRGAGVRTFTLNELDGIAEVLGCTLAELVEDIEVTR